MRIIPVLDVKNGQVVRAQRGQRDQYRPIETRLSATAGIVDVAKGLRSLFPFPEFYVADLDAIGGATPDICALDQIASLNPSPQIWLDAGLADEDALGTLLERGNVYPVLGSESQKDTHLLRAHCADPRIILSLDFFADGFRGPAEILDNVELWPATLIVMTLGRVGSAEGPDFARLTEIRKRAGDRLIVAAGGVRNAKDLADLTALGIGAALIATSLHDGTLDPAALTKLV